MQYQMQSLKELLYFTTHHELDNEQEVKTYKLLQYLVFISKIAYRIQSKYLL